MKQKTFILFLTLAGMALLAGCGGGGGSSPGADKNALHESETCIGCHEKDSIASNWTTPGTGKPVVNDWKASTHNSTTNGASCQDCHGSGYMHPTSCNKCHSIGIAAVNPILNPDAEDRCANCHAKVNPRGKSDGFNLLTYSDPKIPAGSTTAFTHFSSSTGNSQRANYVATNYKQYCRKCHNPHDTAFGREQRKQWAESGHGSTVTANANRDFKISGSSIPAKDNFGNYCVRCHTSTGYIKYVTSGFSDVQALPDFNGNRNNYPFAAVVYSDKSRETVSCNTCHDDVRSAGESAYSGKLRVVGIVTTYFNYSTSPIHPHTGTNPLNAKEGVWDVKLAEIFPNYNGSNVCVACHGGREIGKVIRNSAELGNTYLNTTSRGVFAHDRNAASTLSGISGFEFYVDHAMYQDPNLKHNTINSIPSTGPNAGRSNGPCITCHMENESNHHFLPVERSTTGVITSVIGNASVCNKCHSWTATTGSADDINIVKNGYKAALLALQKLVAQKLTITPSASSSTVTGLSLSYSATKWKTLGTASAPAALGGLTGSAYTLGAAYNLEMLQLDPGAYVHNPVYVRRLIYDSIDWFNNAAMDSDAKAALGALYPLGIADPTYVAALKYLCKTDLDPDGTLGNRP